MVAGIKRQLLGAAIAAVMLLTACAGSGTDADTAKTSAISEITDTSAAVSLTEEQTEPAAAGTTASEAEKESVTSMETTARKIPEGAKVIALTFDDGPNTSVTVDVLDKLEKYNVVGSFFLIGQNITPLSAQSVKRAAEMGCDIENHSWTHRYMNTLTAEEIKKEIEDTSDKIYEITGRYPQFFRPPFIVVNDTMFDNIDLPFICGIHGEDWDRTVTAEQRAERILKQAKDGAIVLLHDMPGNDATVEALDTIIPELQAQGYELVTISQLFEAKGITPSADKNIVYSFADQTE